VARGREKGMGEGKTPEGMKDPEPYEGVGIISDAVHGYIHYCRPVPGLQEGATEEALLDNPWVQRLRYIHQLQSAFWVYPSAEHSRFQHSLGAMHVAGRFASHLWPGLSRHFPHAPSMALVESLMRVAGLLHDLGHGPFSHMFDSEYLEPRWGINHEVVGGFLIKEFLSHVIRSIRRSPSGVFSAQEALEPHWVAYLIKRPSPGQEPEEIPAWLQVLRVLFSSGIFTVDSLDFVRRDAYMSGLSRDPIDMERILHYSFISEKGVTYSSYGLAALQQFLQARINLFQAIYYHRTTRALDLSIQAIFSKTMKELLPRSPLEDPEKYLELTEYSLFNKVRQWAASRVKRLRDLGQAWSEILQRKRQWVTAYERTFYLDARDRTSPLADLFLRRDPENRLRIQQLIREKLPASSRSTKFVVDLASHDPRPDNPLDPQQCFWILNQNTGQVEQETLAALLENVPYRIIKMRLMASDHACDEVLAGAAEALLSERLPSYTTNV
jgi:HD superfamily phosphohydrolase